MKNDNDQALAEPGEDARQRSVQLIRHISQACRQADGQGGMISFADYMNMALYQPGLGYYSGGLQKFGESGDFITAPEVSPLFAQCLAGQVADIFRSLDNQPCCIEFGAGSGVLAADMLLQLEKLGSLPQRYLILELSAELQERQRQTITEKAPQMIDRVCWLQALPEEVSDAVVIANEVLDAMPVECFRKNGNDIERLMVTVEDDALVSRYTASDDDFQQQITKMLRRSDIVMADGYRSEFNPSLMPWLAAIEENIDRLVVLLIDYGYNEREYYHADRVEGTLMCYYRHKAHDDYLRWPGLQDITAFVNFSDVAYSAVESQLQVAGYTTQAAFLLANGLSELHAEQVSDDIKQQITLSQQIKTLTLPSEMGERFKVMALTKNYEQPIKGFSMLDLRSRL